LASTPSWLSLGVGALVADLVINKPLRLSPPMIEFKRAHLYDINPGRLRRYAACDHCRHRRADRRARHRRPGAGGVHRARRGLHRFARDRLCDARRLLHRTHAAARLGRPDHDPLRDLRASLRSRGYGAVSGLFRRDLLSVLLARNPLPRSVQAARARLRPVPQAVAAAPAGMGGDGRSTPTSGAISVC